MARSPCHGLLGKDAVTHTSLRLQISVSTIIHYVGYVFLLEDLIEEEIAFQYIQFDSIFSFWVDRLIILIRHILKWIMNIVLF